MSVTYSTKHPHEPEIPPALDPDGRCLVCGLLVKLEQAEQQRDDFRDLLAEFKDALAAETDQPAPDFEEARRIADQVVQGRYDHEYVSRLMAKKLAHTVEFLLSEREAREEWEKGLREALDRETHVLYQEIEMLREALAAQSEGSVSNADLEALLAAVEAARRYRDKQTAACRDDLDDKLAALPATESAQAEKGADPGGR